MLNLVFTELALIVVAGLAVLTAKAVFGLELRKESDRNHPLLEAGLSGTVGYAAGAVAFLLGLMLLFSVQHFSDAKATATNEAIAYAAAFDATTVLPADESRILQRDLVCLMRATKTGSWISASNLDLTGDENTQAWHQRTLKDLDNTQVANDNDKEALANVDDELTSAGKESQSRLLLAEGDLPLVIWLVIFLSIYVLCFLVALTLLPHPMLMGWSIGSMVLLTGGIFAALVMFAQPFSEPGITVQPTALSGVMLRLENSYPGQIWEPCPVLKEYVNRSGDIGQS